MQLTNAPPEQSDECFDPARIFVAIPTLNEARHIEACIRSLMAEKEQLLGVPVTVVDGGSSDDTVGIVKRLSAEFPNLRILHNPKRLQAAAVNLAVAIHARPDARYLVRCDAHSIYPPGFIRDVTAALVRTGAASVVIPMDAVGETCFEKANAWIVDTPLGSGGSAHRGGRQSGYVDHGHHAGFDLDVFRALGGYDETFSHNEDAEYDERVAQSGGHIYLEASIRKTYIPRGSITGLAKQYYNYGKGRARNVRKHKRPMKIRQMLPVLALSGSVVGLLAGPFFTPALALPVGYLTILASASVLVCISRRSACGLLAGVASGTMHMSWAAGFIAQSVSGPR